MGVSINGNNITITNATIELVNALNEESGVAYIIITPEGGVGSLPFMSTGEPGHPPLFTSITTEIVPHNEELPAENPEYILVDEGGPGLPSKYAAKFFLPGGPPGESGVEKISQAKDFDATSPAPGALTDGYQVAYDNTSEKFHLVPPQLGAVIASGTIDATSFASASSKVLTTINIPAMPRDYIPLPFGSTIVTGTGGATPTRVDLVARLGDSSSGAQLGYARGIQGANEAGIPTVLMPTFKANETISSYARVAAGNTASVHLVAEQKLPSSSPWSTPGSPDTAFAVALIPVG